MTTQKDSAYPHFKPKISPSELEAKYSPTKYEVEFIQGLVNGPAVRTAMMVHLKML